MAEYVAIRTCLFGRRLYEKGDVVQFPSEDLTAGFVQAHFAPVGEVEDPAPLAASHDPVPSDSGLDMSTQFTNRDLAAADVAVDRRRKRTT